MIARILSPFLRWLDRRIDARIAAHRETAASDSVAVRPASGEFVFIPKDVAEHLTDFRVFRQVGCRPRLEWCEPPANLGLERSA